jgi:predicted DCC family thiol-disulfide oxidoreductase YuxK
MSAAPTSFAPDLRGSRMDATPSPGAIVLFDGICHLCQGSVRFIAERDPKAQFRFAPLQSRIGEALMRRHGLPYGDLSSLVLIEDERAYSRSTAALRIARRLRGAWWLTGVLLVVPAFLRDWVYDLVVARRYRWFGRSEQCEIPSGLVRARLVDEDEIGRERR